MKKTLGAFALALSLLLCALGTASPQNVMFRSQNKPPVQGTGDFNQPAWITANAKAYWRMDGAEPGDVTFDSDVTGRGNDLFFDSAPSLAGIAAGHVGNAREFVAADSTYGTRPSTSDLQIPASGDFIIAVWVKPNDLSDTRPVLGKGSGGEAGGYEVGILSDGQVYFQTFAGGDGANSAPGAVATSAWSLIVARYSNATGKMYVRVNNGATAETNIFTPYVAESFDFHVGANLDQPFFFDGSIDELLIASSATPLTDDDFNALCVYLWNGGAGRDLSVLF